MPIDNKEKLNFTHGWKSPKKKYSLHRSMANISLWLGAHQNTSSQLPQVVWALVSLQNPAVPSSHIQHCPIPCSDVPPQPWHTGITSQQSSTGHLATCRAADSPHVPQLSQLPIPFLVLFLSVADTLSKSPSPVKGAPLTSTSELALHSRHHAQARAKQYQVSEVRWIYVAGHCRGWLSARQGADEAKTLFMLALSRLQATSQDAKAHIPALRLSLPQQLVPEQ